MTKLFSEVESFYHHDDPSHDLSHILRVAANTQKLMEPGDSLHEVLASALMHDIVNIPKNDPRRAEASLLCAKKSREILQKLDWEPAAIERIALAIEDHSFSRGQTPRNRVGQILQDADRLESVGAIGLMRVFATGVKIGAQFFHATDPWAESRELDDKKYSVDHFFTKLLKLQDTFQTERGRALARNRTQVLKEFLENLRSEIE